MLVEIFHIKDKIKLHPCSETVIKGYAAVILEVITYQVEIFLYFIGKLLVVVDT